MTIRTEFYRNILNDFLERWPIETVKEMMLSDYVSIGNKDTFCQWLETKTKELGSIHGITSSKFGIYKRSDRNKRPKNLVNDTEYSWQRYYSKKNSKEAFINIKNEILQIINYSQHGQFEEIEKFHLTVFVKWKIAYLYSNERLIPIFRKDALTKIANHFGLSVNSKTKISEIQKLMIANKPAHLSIYEYSKKLYDKFGIDKKKEVKEVTKMSTRHPSQSKNVSPQIRQGSASYLAVQKHNQLQEALKSKLIEKYGEANVILEENYVDIKVLLENKILIYEVKSAAFASDCIREALGQILSYSQRDTDRREKTLIVAGQYKPNKNELEFISYIKKSLKIDFEYENIELEE